MHLVFAVIVAALAVGWVGLQASAPAVADQPADWTTEVLDIAEAVELEIRAERLVPGLGQALARLRIENALAPPGSRKCLFWRGTYGCPPYEEEVLLMVNGPGGPQTDDFLNFVACQQIVDCVNDGYAQGGGYFYAKLGPSICADQLVRLEFRTNQQTGALEADTGLLPCDVADDCGLIVVTEDCCPAFDGCRECDGTELR